jgi:hypothetical protein
MMGSRAKAHRATCIKNDMGDPSVPGGSPILLFFADDAEKNVG